MLDLRRPHVARPRAGPSRGRRADTRHAWHHPAEVPGGAGGTPAACVHEGAAQPLHGAEPAQQHPQRRLDDRRLPRSRTARTLARGLLERDVAGALRVAHVPLARIPGERLPVADRGAAGAGDRPAVTRAARHLRNAERARPAGHEGVPELRRRRLLLPRRARPRLERHQDEPSVRASGLSGRPDHHQTHDYDLTSVLEPDERISSALPDFRGRIWFVSKKNGKVAILNTKTGRIRAIRLGEDIQNSFTVDRRGIYVV